MSTKAENSKKKAIKKSQAVYCRVYVLLEFGKKTSESTSWHQYVTRTHTSYKLSAVTDPVQNCAVLCAQFWVKYSPSYSCNILELELISVIQSRSGLHRLPSMDFLISANKCAFFYHTGPSAWNELLSISARKQTASDSEDYLKVVLVKLLMSLNCFISSLVDICTAPI